MIDIKKEKEVKEKAEKFYKCKGCEEPVSENDAIIHEQLSEKTGKTTKERYHKECYEPYQERRNEKKKFDRVYEYIKNEIFQLHPNQNLSSHLVLRLQSLRSGEYLMKGSKVDRAYTYEEMYYSFVASRNDIVNAFKSTEFTNEQHKIDYMMVIMHSHINIISERLKRKEKAEDSLQYISSDIVIQKNEYIKKENKLSLFKDLL